MRSALAAIVLLLALLTPAVARAGCHDAVASDGTQIVECDKPSFTLLMDGLNDAESSAKQLQLELGALKGKQERLELKLRADHKAEIDQLQFEVDLWMREALAKPAPTWLARNRPWLAFTAGSLGTGGLVASGALIATEQKVEIWLPTLVVSLALEAIGVLLAVDVGP